MLLRVSKFAEPRQFYMEFNTHLQYCKLICVKKSDFYQKNCIKTA